MKTKLMFCALALVAGTFAVSAQAEARNYIPYKTTAVRLADQATVIVTGRLLRVEDVQLAGTGLDASRWERKDQGQWQDGQAGIRRDAVIQVTDVLKGAVAAGSELRVVSMRQLKFDAYDTDLRSGEALYFIAPRSEDGRNIVLMDERGTISAPESAGNLAFTADYVRGYLGVPGKAAFLTKLLAAVSNNGTRVSVDSCIELSWNHEDYAAAITDQQKQQVVDLARASSVGSAERNELITAIGRYQPETGMDALFDIMLTDTSWSTTSLASMSMEYINRGMAISRLLQEWNTAQAGQKLVIVRSLGLIRPKADFDGPEVRNQTLSLVGGLLVASTEKNLLREALIASRDLRSEDAHVAALKVLIDQRATNGLGDDEVKAAVVALAAARRVTKSQSGPDVVTVLEKNYLTALGNADPVLKQVVEAAIKFPFTTLIAGADGRGH